MKENKTQDIIPQQRSGISINSEEEVSFKTKNEAIIFFEVAKARLKKINQWHEIAENISAKFFLVDKNGYELSRDPEKGDYLKIDIPGPGSESGEGYDWVQIKAIKIVSDNNKEIFGFKVRPVPNPQNNGEDISHFYSHKSTSTFKVEREKNRIIAGIYDRNTKPNTDADSIPDKVRDMVTGTAGALLFSKIQWKGLVDGILKVPK